MKLLEITRSFYPNVGGLENFIYKRLKIYKTLDIRYSILSTNLITSKVDNSSIPNNQIVLKQYTPYNITPGLQKYLDSDYDIVSINLLGRYFSDFSILYSKKKGKKIILTPHFSFHTRKYPFLKKIHEQLIAPHILKYVDKMICFTQFEKEFWIENYNINEDKIDVIPHYIELRDADASLSNSSSYPYLFYLGRYDENKKIDFLLNAFDQLQSSDLNLYLTINKNELPSNLIPIVERNSKIKLLGFVTDKEKWDYLINCEGLIFPSEYEAFGHVLLEASLCQKPILCSSIPVFKEILVPEGVLYFENSTSSILESLYRFLALSEESKKLMGRNNYKNLQRYSFQQALNSYKKLFNEI